MPANTIPTKAAIKPAPITLKEDRVVPKPQPGHETKQHNRAGDPDRRKDLPTSDHVASKENQATVPNDDTMSNLPGTFQTAAPTGPTRSKVDNTTLSDQPGTFRPADEVGPRGHKLDQDTMSDQPETKPSKR